MTVLFAHDHIFHKYHDKYYTTGALPQKTLAQYKEVFGSVIVVSRQREVESEEGVSISSLDNVKFINVPNFKSIKTIHKRYTASSIIKNQVLNADYVIARLPSEIGAIAIKYAKKFDKPYLIELVGSPFYSFFHHSFLGKIIAPIKYLETKSLLKKSKYTIYVTENYLQKEYPSLGKFTNCSNVILDKVPDKVLRDRIERIKNNDGKIVLGTIGSLDAKYKGQKYVLTMMDKMESEQLEKFEYQMVGLNEKKLYENIESNSKLNKKVKFLGKIEREKVKEWLDTIDVYIQPSLTEGLPRATIEAMSRGLPVISSNAGGLSELVQEEFRIPNIRNQKQLETRLISLTDEIMIEQAKLNFYKAKNYYETVIRTRKIDFLKMFKKENRIRRNR